MAKQKNAPGSKAQPEKKQPQPQAPAKHHPLLYFIIFAFSFLIYSNTLYNLYAIDDVIVLTDNKFTKKGLAGIKDHLTHDMFEGFFGERGAKLVSGGRYRPLSMISLTIEYEITRKLKGDPRQVIDDKNIIIGSENDPYLSPKLSHFINVLLFGLTCVLLYHVLRKILPAQPAWRTPLGDLGIAFFASLLYAAHPVHTEAVANIKGRDEVMCMFFSLGALYAAIQYVKTQRTVHIVWGTFVFFLALMSKENAITFLAVVPMVYYFFLHRQAKTTHYIWSIGLYTLATALFLALRKMNTQSGVFDESPEILNNPFVGATFAQRIATAIYIFMRYYWVMLFPVQLTHDYYYNQIPIIGPGDPKFLFSLLITAALLMYAFWNVKKRDVGAFSILFFFATFSVASNILFTVGVLMNERFIYMSSLGFCILLAYCLLRLLRPAKTPAVILLLIATLYSVKTYSRNFDWLDSFTLFRRDVKYSPNSAKIQTSLGGDLTKAADFGVKALRDSGMIRRYLLDLNPNLSEAYLANVEALPDSSLRQLLLDSSIMHLRKAIEIYPTHSNAFLLLGNALYKRYNDPKMVIDIYQKANAYRVGGYYDAYFNLGIVYNDINQPDSAIANLRRALAMKPEVPECKFLLAQNFAKKNMPDSVAYWVQRFSAERKMSAGEYYLLGTAYGKVGGNLPAAIENIKKAIELQPNVEVYYEDLAVAYGFSGKYDEAIATSQQLIKLNPNYPAAYLNISISYRNKGNKQLADEYLAKYEALKSGIKR
ncbi:MAG: tetratricopeptide repeat protein [Chitinophagales bacterium]|nr:tetratricopeptide repeat protein [Chitinophagales bacterium]